MTHFKTRNCKQIHSEWLQMWKIFLIRIKRSKYFKIPTVCTLLNWSSV